MKPSGRRRIERAIRTIIESDGDRCSMCKKTFEHNSKTFGGAAAGGVAVLVGECCRRRIKELVTQGVYVNRAYDDFAQRADSPASGTLAPQDVPVAVERLQEHFTSVDKFGSEIAKKGGLLRGTPRLHTSNSSWKADDAAWFKANPTRSHRLRPTLAGEVEGLFDRSSIPVLPSGHEHQVLVRQVEPGTRLRIPFGRNLEIPIPDIEAVVHALFDIVAGSNGGVVNAREVIELAKRYEGADSKAAQLD